MKGVSRKTRYIFGIFGIFCMGLLLGCTVDNKKTEFDIISCRDKAVDFPNIIDTLSYRFIPLETTQSSILGDIVKVEIIDDGIFILDQSTGLVHKFNIDGKFICKIGNKGRGPGVYFEARNFVVNHKDKQILICDKETGFILRYDLDGNFISSCRMRSAEFAYLPNMNEIVFLSSPMETSEKYELRKFKLCSEEQVEGYIPHPKYEEKEAYFVIKNYFLQQQDSYFFIPLYTDKLYNLSDKGIELIHEFGFQKDMFNHDKAEMTTDHLEHKKLGSITNFHMNSKGSYMFNVGYGKDIQFDVVGNIHTKRIEAGGAIAKQTPISTLFALNPVGVLDEYFISSVSYGYLFPSYFPSAALEDNPILVLYKLKNDN